MKVVQHTNQVLDNFGATLGNFDGVHKGHLAMLEEARLSCVEKNLKFAVITFFPHPAQILKAQRGFLLSSYQERRKLLESAGVNYLVEIPFTREFSSMTANSFAEDFVVKINQLKLLCLGYDFAFGANKSGDVNTFKSILSKTDKEIFSLKEYKDSECKVSSSQIRLMIKSGDVAGVVPLLGRNFRLSGVVVHGQGRGKGIGFPTANIRVSDEIITPSTGVYATRSLLDGVAYKSVTNIGFNPTFNDSFKMTIETHLLNSISDFYDHEMEVEFLGKIREERRFESVEHLKAQIARDVETARNWS